MKCPIDPTIDLVMTERSGIEIDYCPTCRGVWLDRGELDKIIERNVGTPTPAAALSTSAAPAAPVAPAPSPPPQKRWDDDWDDDRRRAEGGYEYDKKYKKKKRSSFLEEIFDF
jgi:uncharacterized protein